MAPRLRLRKTGANGLTSKIAALQTMRLESKQIFVVKKFVLFTSRMRFGHSVYIAETVDFCGDHSLDRFVGTEIAAPHYMAGATVSR